MMNWNEDIPPEKLRSYQLECINDQVARLLERSRAYGSFCGGVSLPIRTFSDFEKLPFITAEDIIDSGTGFVCVPQRWIRRIVSRRTSGTQSQKRIYFTSGDIERNISFFSEGMQYMCSADDTVVIFMPGTAPDGISAQLRAGLIRFGAKPSVYGLITDYGEAAAACAQLRPHTLVGMPASMRRLALTAPDLRPENVLLSADYISRSACSTIVRIWGCEVFAHYGLTESCYGFAVDCPGHTGMHIRNDEFYLEIIDPISGAPKPPGKEGIITITTLKREAMPLIRYKTGDIGLITARQCACGMGLPRLERVLGRERALLRRPNINELDELLFCFDDVLDFKASYGGGILSIEVLAKADAELGRVERALKQNYPEMSVKLKYFNGAGAAQVGKRAIEYTSHK